MSDVSKTNEALIASARFYASLEYPVVHKDVRALLPKLADALEATTGVRVDMSSAVGVETQLAARVPVQGEPNDDRETLRDEFRSYLGDEVYVCSRDHSAWSHGTMGLDDFSLAADDDGLVESLVQIASRTTVPDAREHLHAKCDCVPDLGPAHCHLCGNVKGSPVTWDECDSVTHFVPDAVEPVGKADALGAATERVQSAWRKDHREMLAKLDAATDALERVRAVANEWECDEDAKGLHFDLLAALDGAPEPEWEYSYAENYDGDIYDYGSKFATKDEADTKVSGRIEDTDALVKRIPGVPAGPWLPVEGESKT